MSTLSRTNTYPGRCCVCGDDVGAQKGYLLRSEELADPSLCKSKWATICTSRLCISAVLGQGADSVVDSRELQADGLIVMPYDEDALPLLRAIASWDHGLKTWRASPLYRDRDLVLRVAEKLGLEISPGFATYEDPEPVRAAVARARAIPTIREYQVQGVRWLAYRGTTYGAPEDFEDKKPGAVLADDMGCGKQQPVDSLVLTPTGWREIGALVVGDSVIGSDGKPTRVRGVFPQGVKPSYRVHFSDGSSVEAGPEHLWTVYYMRGGKKLAPLTVTTDQLRTGATLGQSWEGRRPTKLCLGKTALRLPMLKAPVEFAVGAQLPVPPYTLGALIANGGLSHGAAQLTVGACDWAEVHARLLAEGADIRTVRNPVPTVSTTNVCGTIGHIRALKLDVVSRHKFIPEAYTRATPAQRIALLHGLMDGDGSCSATRNKITYHTTSARLAYDVRELVEGLGGVASIRSYDRSHDNKPTGYQVRIRLPRSIPPFSISRKLDRYKPGKNAHPVRTFVKAEYVRDVASVCISVEASDQLYVTERCILTHNTIQALLALHDDEALLVECPANAKAVWPREAEKWRPGRFDKVTICEGAESFVWPENPRHLVAINYDILPFTPAQIKQERETLLGKRRGVKPDRRAKKKADREGKVGLLAPMREAGLLEDHLRHTAKTTAQRHALYLNRCKLVEHAAKLRNNYRALVRNAKRKPAGQPNCKTFVVADEAHYTQNNKAARTVKHRYIVRRATRLVCATGTPVEDDPLKAWGVLQSARCNPFSWTSFKEQFSAFDGAWGGLDFRRHPPREGSTAKGPVIVQPGTTEILSRALLRRTKEQVLKELPPKIFSEIPVEISAKLTKILDEITAANIDLLMQGELPAFGMTSEVRKLLALASIPAALAEVESYELAGVPLIVFSAHRAPIEKLKGRKGWAVITGDVSGKMRGEIQDAFQAGKLVGVAGTRAMCEAMTLTRAHNVLQIDPFWELKFNKQAYDRAHRIGQKDTVHVVRLVPDHPLTRHCADLLAGKDQFFADVLHGEAEYEKPPSRYVDEDHDGWAKRVEAKRAKDEERAEAARVREARKLERELAEISRRRVTPKVSEARAAARAERLGASALYHAAPPHVVRDALEYMLSVCDGAREKDNAGFNQPDACVARWLAPGVCKLSEYATASAAAILRKYPRQLADRFPALFDGGKPYVTKFLKVVAPGEVQSTLKG